LSQHVKYKITIFIFYQMLILWSRSKLVPVILEARKARKEIHKFEWSIRFFPICCSSMHRLFYANATSLIVESHWNNGLPAYTAPQSGRSCCSCQPQHGARPASFFRSIRSLASEDTMQVRGPWPFLVIGRLLVSGLCGV